MTESVKFDEWIDRVQAGNPDAAAEFVVRYLPKVRRVVRVQLIRCRLSRSVDATDICQSVLTDFYRRASARKFQIDSPQRLQALLLTIARNRVRDAARRRRAELGDARRVEGEASDDALESAAAAGPTPSKIVADREMIERLQQQFSPAEQALFDDRSLGQDWEAIARARGGRPDALRKKLARAIERVMEHVTAGTRGPAPTQAP